MKILAIDSSSKTATAAIVDENGVIGEYSINHLKHSVILMPMIDELLKMSDVKIHEITHIAVSEGPGSFTGLRIGAATAKGLAQALDIPVVGVSSLYGLAYNVHEFKGIICPIIDALRGNVYTFLMRGGRELEKLSDISVCSIGELTAILKNYSEYVVFVGDGVYAYKKELEEAMGDLAVFAPHSSNMARASSIGQIAVHKIERGNVSTYIDFKPIYIRKSAAEIHLAGEES